MRHQTTLIFNESLLRSAVLSFWRRSIGVGLPVSLALVAGAVGWVWSTGDRSWIVGVGIAMLGFGIVISGALYVVHYRNVMHKLKAMGEPQARFQADSASFTVESGIGSSTLGWPTVREVWRFPDCWLLVFARGQFMTLPLACVPSEMQDFILERVRASGGVIS